MALAQLFILLIGHNEHEGVQHAAEVLLGQAAIVVVVKLVEGTSQSLQHSSLVEDVQQWRNQEVR